MTKVNNNVKSLRNISQFEEKVTVGTGISNVKWLVPQAMKGEKVPLLASCDSSLNGQTATVEVFKQLNKTKVHTVGRLTGKFEGNQLKGVVWTVTPATGGDFTEGEYCAIVTAANGIQGDNIKKGLKIVSSVNNNISQFVSNNGAQPLPRRNNQGDGFDG